MNVTTPVRLLVSVTAVALTVFSAGGAPPGEAPATTRTAVTGVTVPNSQQFDLRSAEGRVYRIFVAEPRGGPRPAAGYAALYVLDANAMFLTAVDATRFQHGLVPTVVVGVGYPTDATVDQDRRYYDFTPVTPPERLLRSGTEPPVKPGGTGGQDEFLRFLLDVVKPEVGRRLPIDASRDVLFGHSLAGRFVLHTLFTRPGVFHGYAAASPSIWWDGGSVLREGQAFVGGPNRTRAAGRSLLVTVGEMEQRTAPGTPKPRAEFLAQAKMVDNAKALTSALGSGDPDLHVALVEYPGENHGSVVLFAISRAVRELLSASLPPGERP